MSVAGMTELEAINKMLAAVSQSKVSSITGATTETVGLAVSILKEVKREVLMDGWMFNSDKELPMQPDATTSQIAINSNVLRIDGSLGRNGAKDLTERSGLLYDRKERVYTFTENIYVDIVFNLEFSDMPEAAKIYIAAQASWIMVTKTFSEGANEFLLQARQALIRLKRHESSVRDANMLTDSVHTINVINRRSPFRGR